MSRVINPEGRAALEAAIDARIASGVRAARYDGDDGSSTRSEIRSVVEREIVGEHRPETPGRAACPAVADPDFFDPDTVCDCTIRPDPVSDKACFDQARAREAIRVLQELEAEYEPQHRGKTPGIGPCPAGACQDHWKAGIQLAAARKRYTNLCRMCGDHRKRNGYPIPALVLRALNACGNDWGHWSVRRAQRAG